MVDAVMGAMSKALPERIPAAGCGHANIFLAGGRDDSGRRFTGALGGPLRSGTGARPQKDGIDVADHELSNVFHVPLEVTESEFPIRYERLGLWTDSGGAGLWRGGLGFHAQVDWLEGDAVLSVRGERHKFRPWGARNGLSPPRCRYLFRQKSCKKSVAENPSDTGRLVAVDMGGQPPGICAKYWQMYATKGSLSKPPVTFTVSKSNRAR
jgi:N-methylhydantoinase B/oxoprolinase/acetone carboxylase alpha subunit